MEEIRKQRLVRGIACALWGALDRRGLAVRRCELPRMCYRLLTLHLFRRMSASRKQLAKRSRLKLYFGQDQGAASLPTTWIVRRVRQPRATLRWLFSARCTVFFTYPKGVPRVFPLVRLLCFFFLGCKLIVNRVCYHSP